MGRQSAPKLVIAALILLLAGCTSSASPEPNDRSPVAVSVAPSPISCKGEECTGKEVNETGCDKQALTVVEREIALTNVWGILALRQGNPTICPSVFWARFIPSPQNVGAFEVRVKRNAIGSASQSSDPSNPAITAWSVGIYAPAPSDQLDACVSDGTRETCVKNYPA